MNLAPLRPKITQYLLRHNLTKKFEKLISHTELYLSMTAKIKILKLWLLLNTINDYLAKVIAQTN